MVPKHKITLAIKKVHIEYTLTFQIIVITLHSLINDYYWLCLVFIRQLNKIKQFPVNTRGGVLTLTYVYTNVCTVYRQSK